MKAFSKIFSLGDRHIEGIFDNEVEITEKLDGSQLGFGVNLEGELECRSKRVSINLNCPNNLFEKGIEYILSIKAKILEVFPKGTYFWAEYLSKSKHNLLGYSKIPKNYLILFGCEMGNKLMDDYSCLSKTAEILDIDVVPLLHKGLADVGFVKKLLETESILGGTNIEGVIVKNYQKEIQVCGTIFLPAFGKYVSEKFKEKADKEWRTEHTTKGKLDTYIDNLCTEARWNKAIQHLRDSGKLSVTPKDIGILIPEIMEDVLSEEKENIKEVLFSICEDQIKRVVIKGFPEWYKQKLLETLS